MEEPQTGGPAERRIIFADSGQKERPHLVLASHGDRDTVFLNALALRTRRLPTGYEIPGCVEVPREDGGLDVDSVVTLSLHTLLAPSENTPVRCAALPTTSAQVADNIRTLLGLPPNARADRRDHPRFLQHLPPPSLRRKGTEEFRSFIDSVHARGWVPPRQGEIYSNHGWHRSFNAADRFFLVVSVDDLHDRYPIPLAWVVPVTVADVEAHPPWIIRLAASAPTLPGTTPWFADIRFVHSLDPSRQWFTPCPRCFGGGTKADFQCWRMAPPDSREPGRCVRCDRVPAEWPLKVAQAHPRDLATIRAKIAAYLGVN